MMDRETIMQQWDKMRRRIAEGDKSSGPRDWFESILDCYDEEISEMKRWKPSVIIGKQRCKED